MWYLCLASIIIVLYLYNDMRKDDCPCPESMLGHPSSSELSGAKYEPIGMASRHEAERVPSRDEPIGMAGRHEAFEKPRIDTFSQPRIDTFGYTGSMTKPPAGPFGSYYDNFDNYDNSSDPEVIRDLIDVDITNDYTGDFKRNSDGISKLTGGKNYSKKENFYERGVSTKGDTYGGRTRPSLYGSWSSYNPDFKAIMGQVRKDAYSRHSKCKRFTCGEIEGEDMQEDSI